jgi:hypothetical protein
MRLPECAEPPRSDGTVEVAVCRTVQYVCKDADGRIVSS